MYLSLTRAHQVRSYLVVTRLFISMLVGALLLSTLGISTNTTAAEVFSEPFQTKDPVYADYEVVNVYLEGKIEKGDLDKIKHEAAGKIIRGITIWSSGGSVEEALNISNFANERMIYVKAPAQYNSPPCEDPITDKIRPRKSANCVCNSACAIIWLLAPWRGGNIVGIHRPRFDHKEFAGLTPPQAKIAYNKMIDDVKQRLQDERVNAGIIERMMSTPSNDIYYLTEQDFRVVGKRSAFLEELLIAKCERFLAQNEEYMAIKRDYDKAFADSQEACSQGTNSDGSLTEGCANATLRFLQMGNELNAASPKEYNKCFETEWQKMAVDAQQ